MIILIPLVFSCLLIIFWLFYKMMYKLSFMLTLEHILLTISISIHFFLSSIINALADFINCSDLNNDSYITNYLMEKCSNNLRYLKWRNYLVIPSFAIFAGFLPTIAFLYTYSNRERLFDKKVIKNVRFFLNGYSTKTFYWYIYFYFYLIITLFREFLFLLQKIILILIISLVKIGSDEVHSQNNGFLCLVLCTLSCYAQIKDQPFITDELNDLNFKANFVMILTIFVGLFSSICRDYNLEIFLMIVLVFFNCFFISVFVKNYLAIKIITSKNTNKFYKALEHIFNKNWKNGKLLFFFILFLFYFRSCQIKKIFERLYSFISIKNSY